MLRGIGPRRRAAGLITFVATVAAIMLVAPAAFATTGAINTTVDPGQTVNSTTTLDCIHGTAVNCNLYAQKEDVFLSGSPSSTGSGTYFFAVLQPSGQPNPNDGSGDLLSTDAVTNREFFLAANGTITKLNSSDHLLDGSNNELSAFPFNDTGNNGGVYIMAVCKISDTNGFVADPSAVPSDCKYDAFKVKSAGPPPETPPASGATVTKDASGAYNTTYTWGITKSACAHGVNPCKQSVNALSGNVTFDYTVKVTHSAGTNSGIKVTGTISVFNPNTDVTNTLVPMDISSLTDSTSDGTDCTVTGAPTTGNPVTLSDFQTDFPYECDYSSLPATPLSNTVTVGWDDQDLNLSGDPSNLSHLAAGTNDFEFDNIAFTQTKIGNCITVTDNFNNAVTADTLGTFCVGGSKSNVSSSPAVTATYASPTWTLTYSRSIAVVADMCKSYMNTATFTGANVTSGLLGSDSATVTICGPVAGGLTMGFWQNNNGQAIIKADASTSGVCNVGTWLRNYNPFKDLSASATCNQVATYVAGIIKSGGTNCGGATCNALLKAQMLATALDVYFSTPGLGGNKINAPLPLGGVKVNVSAWASAFSSSCETVGQMLSDASGQSNSGGSTWYGQNKATQVNAKSAFDAINNQVAFTC